MKKLTTEQVRSIFLELGCELLGEYNGCDLPVSYRCKCGEIGYISLDKLRKRKSGCKYCRTKKWTELDDECLRLNYGKMPRKKILELIPGATLQDIKTRAFSLGLKGNVSLVQRQARVGKGRKYEIDFSFFDVIDPVRSYWAGLIAAIGDLNEDRSRLSLKMHKNYLSHILSFKDYVGYTGAIHELECQVLLQCHGVIGWLDNLNKNYFLTPRKSSTLQPPTELDEDNSLSFIVGYIDGKGEIVLHDGDLRLELYGTQDMLCWIKVWFDRLCPSVSRRYAVVRPCKNGYLYKYSLTGFRAGYLLRRLNSLEVPRMVCKWKQVGL